MPDLRLTPMGYEIGLISEERMQKFLHKKELIAEERKRTEKLSIPMSEELDKLLVSLGTAPLKTGVKFAELLKRPQLTYENLAPFDKNRPDLPYEIFEQVEIEIKYEGYIKRQQAQIDEMRRLEKKLIPADMGLP